MLVLLFHQMRIKIILRHNDPISTIRRKGEWFTAIVQAVDSHIAVYVSALLTILLILTS